MSLLVHILLHLLLHHQVINPLSSTTLAGLKQKLLLQLIYHNLLLSRVFLLLFSLLSRGSSGFQLLLIYEEEYVPVLLIGSFSRSMLSLLISTWRKPLHFDQLRRIHAGLLPCMKRLLPSIQIRLGPSFPVLRIRKLSAASGYTR